MKRSLSHTLAAIILAGGLTACQTAGPKETAGTIIGGVGGAVVGSQFGSGSGKVAMTALGTMGGMMIGQSIGASLDRADRAYAMQTQRQAVYNGRLGQRIAWRNPRTGNHGHTVVTNVGNDMRHGGTCKEYQTTIYIDGAPDTAYGAACQDRYGNWRM